MKSLISLLIFGVFYSSLVLADATENNSCEKVLKSSIALSPIAESYVKVIQHHLRQNNSRGDSVLNRILSSQEFINPFAGQVDSRSILLSNAIEKIRIKIKASEWTTIKQAIQELSQARIAQQIDRKEKKEETSWLKTVSHLGTKQFSQSGLDRTDAFIEMVGGRLLSVQWSDGHIFIYEFDEQTGWRDIAHLNKISGWKDATFSWQVIEEKIYLAYLPGNLSYGKIYNDSERTKKFISVFELTVEGLILKSHAETIFGSSEKPVWWVSGAQAYLLTGNQAQNWQLFKFKNEDLNFVSDLEIVKNNAFSPVAWLQNSKRRFLAVIEDRYIVVKELIANRLVEVDKIENKNEISNLHLQQVGDRIFLSAIQKQEAFKGGVSFLYEIEGNTIDLVARLEFAKRVGREKPVIYIENNNVYTIHDSDMALIHHEMAADKSTRLVENLPVPRNLTSPVGSFAIGHRRFVFFGTFADRQYLYEIINGAFVFLHEALGGRQEKAFATFVVGDNFHLAYPFKEKVRSESYKYQKQIKK